MGSDHVAVMGPKKVVCPALLSSIASSGKLDSAFVRYDRAALNKLF